MGKNTEYIGNRKYMLKKYAKDKSMLEYLTKIYNFADTLDKQTQHEFYEYLEFIKEEKSKIISNYDGPVEITPRLLCGMKYITQAKIINGVESNYSNDITNSTKIAYTNYLQTEFDLILN